MDLVAALESLLSRARRGEIKAVCAVAIPHDDEEGVVMAVGYAEDDEWSEAVADLVAAIDTEEKVTTGKRGQA